MSESKNTWVQVAALPKCNFCGDAANYDGATTLGPWANMCEECFAYYGRGLGLGVGQRLVLSLRDELLTDAQLNEASRIASIIKPAQAGLTK